jgi:hypothetical protein
MESTASKSPIALGALLGLLLAVVIASTAPRLAFGDVGRFNIEACTAAVGYENNSWVFSTNNPTYIESHTVCGEPPISGNPPTLANLSLGDTLGPLGVPVGAAGAFKVAAPAGTTISEVSGTDLLMKVGGNLGWNVYLESEDFAEHVQVAQTCATSAEENECASGGPFQMSGLNAKSVTIGAECDAEEYEPGHSYTTCARGNEFGHAVRAEFDSVTVTITDTIPPTAVTGSKIPTGPQHGTITISGSAMDTIAGLLSLSVIDSTSKTIGGPVTVPGGCDHSLLEPCPTSANELSLPLNTEMLADGTDQIRIVATNAAHEETISPAYTLTIENHPPPPPGGGGSGGNQGGGSTGTQTTTTNTETKPPSGPGGTGKNPLPPLPAKLTMRHRHHDKLLLAGTAPVNTPGVLRFTIRGRLGNHRRWAKKTRITLSRASFHYTFRLPKGLRQGSATIEVLYPASNSYAATRLYRKLAL